MRRRYISIIVALLIFVSVFAAPCAFAIDRTEEVVAQSNMARELMMEEFEESEYRAPQPYGLPDSYAPPGAWEAAEEV